MSKTIIHNGQFLMAQTVDDKLSPAEEKARQIRLTCDHSDTGHLRGRCYHCGKLSADPRPLPHDRFCECLACEPHRTPKTPGHL